VAAKAAILNFSPVRSYTTLLSCQLVSHSGLPTQVHCNPKQKFLASSPLIFHLETCEQRKRHPTLTKEAMERTIFVVVDG
jgi:hypothetical protein